MIKFILSRVVLFSAKLWILSGNLPLPTAPPTPKYLLFSPQHMTRIHTGQLSWKQTKKNCENVQGEASLGLVPKTMSPGGRAAGATSHPRAWRRLGAKWRRPRAARVRGHAPGWGGVQVPRARLAFLLTRATTLLVPPSSPWHSASIIWCHLRVAVYTSLCPRTPLRSCLHWVNDNVPDGQIRLLGLNLDMQISFF